MQVKLSIIGKIVGALVCLFLILYPLNSIRAQDEGSAGVTVSPPKTEITVAKGQNYSGKIKLTNPLDKIVNLYTSVMDFLPEGETGGQKFLPPSMENRQFSLASWVTVGQSKVSLTPEQVVEVDYTVSVPADAEPCGHYAVIFFSSQPPELDPGKTQIAIDSWVGSLLLINVPEATLGECIPSGVAETFTAPWLNLKMPVKFTTRIYNNGATHFRPAGEIKILNWKDVIIDGVKFNEGGGNVLPQSPRRFDDQWGGGSLKWWQQIGRFKAQLGLVYGEQGAMKSLSDSLVFWVIPWWLILIIAFIALFVFWQIIRFRRKMARLRKFYISEKGHRPILR